MKKIIQIIVAIITMMSFSPALILLGIGSLIRLIIPKNKISDLLEFPALWLAKKFLIDSDISSSSTPE